MPSSGTTFDAQPRIVLPGPAAPCAVAGCIAWIRGQVINVDHEIDAKPVDGLISLGSSNAGQFTASQQHTSPCNCTLLRQRTPIAMSDVIVQRKRLDPLTSLRFIAAMFIVIGHGHPYFGSSGLATTFSLAQGVSFFFVLSGFILAYSYPHIRSPFELKKFYTARIARVWPLHIAGILLLYLLTQGLNIDHLSGSLQKIFAGIMNVFLVHSVVPLRDVYLAFNGVSWSLSTELIFYVVFPLLIVRSSLSFAVKHVAACFILTCLLILFAIAWSLPANDSYVGVGAMGLLYVNPVARLFEFSLGVLSCRIFERISAKSASLNKSMIGFIELSMVVIALLSMYLSPRIVGLIGFQGPAAETISYYLSKSGSSVVFAILILVFALGRGFLSRILSVRAFVVLGEISFALYIVHTTVLHLYVRNGSKLLGVGGAGSGVAYWLTCLMISYLMHKAIEEPLRSLIVGKSRFAWNLNSLASSHSFRCACGLLLFVLLLRST